MVRNIGISIMYLTALLIGRAQILYLDNIELGTDSLNVQCVGHWSCEAAWTIAYDAVRDLVFLGSCGCVYFLNVAHPSQPEKIGECKHLACNTSGLYFQENTRHLYVCGGVSGVNIWDVNDPFNPQQLGHYDTPGYACGVHVVDSYAYVADGDGGLRIIDVSAPTDPREISHLDMDAACSVYIRNQHAYIADLGLRIVDISNPLYPVEKSFHYTPGVTQCVHINGEYAYVADDWCGLMVLDISDPEHPHGVGYIATPGYAWDVYVSGSFAYVSTCEAGLFLIDVSNPAAPREVACYDTTCEALHSYVSGSYIYVAAGAHGLQIYANQLTSKQER